MCPSIYPPIYKLPTSLQASVCDEIPPPLCVLVSSPLAHSHRGAPAGYEDCLSLLISHLSFSQIIRESVCVRVCVCLLPAVRCVHVVTPWGQHMLSWCAQLIFVCLLVCVYAGVCSTTQHVHVMSASNHLWNNEEAVED